MSRNMTHADFEIDPFTYIGSTVGNAYFSGLTLEDVYNAIRLAEDERMFDQKINETIFERLDRAVSATIDLKKIESKKET